jgi:hypothetical protein
MVHFGLSVIKKIMTVSVPYWEWGEMQDKQAMKAYLEAKLTDAVHGRSAV